MNSNDTFYVDFEFEQIYHLFTRVNGSELLFRQESNYIDFLEKITKYLIPIFDIYAYCLAPQRFSLMGCFKSREQICKNLILTEEELLEKNIHQFLMQPLSNMLNSYSKSYNKMYKRRGGLFVDYIKREKLDDVDLIKQIFRNIHQIPIENKLVTKLEDWKFCSIGAYSNLNKQSKVDKDFMLNLYGNQENLLRGIF